MIKTLVYNTDLNQMNNIKLALIITLFTGYVHSYGTTITRSTAATASITDFYQDFSYCSCNLTPSLCDNYCCCDTSCSSVIFMLSRQPSAVGNLQKVAFHPHRQYKAFAMIHRHSDLVPSKIFPACTSQTEEPSATSTPIPKQLPLPIPLPQNCINI